MPAPATRPSVFSRVAADFATLCSGPDPLGLNCTPMVGLGVPGGYLSVRALRDWMLTHRDAYDARNAIWRELVARARVAPVWMTATIGVALPGLVRAAGGLARGFGGDPDDIDAEMLAAFIAAVYQVDPMGEGIYDTLRWAAVRAGARVRAADHPYQLPGDVDRLAGAAPPMPYGHPDLIVARAVATGILDPLDADLIILTVLDRTPIEVLAAQRGIDVAVARMRRVRAKRLLVQALREGVLSGAVATDTRRRLDRRRVTSATVRAARSTPPDRACHSGVRPGGCSPAMTDPDWAV